MHLLRKGGMVCEELAIKQFDLSLAVAHGVLSLLTLKGESGSNVIACYSFFSDLLEIDLKA